ncbi:MAG: 2-amino-4-hydroxy-6-hydroxymethyldihydropteridine diphosphokinase [Thioclava marina]|nr:2-amino-4-hydroxy-6-hydroxymethyldihydropteridine diphosphokinase [Thioclava marina]
MDTLSYIALGGNLPSAVGRPEVSLGAALCRLGELGFSFVAISRFWRTPAFPSGSGPDYVNAVCRVRSDLQKDAILATLHKVENEFGRQRDGRWASRGLDLDLLAVGDQVCPDLETWTHWRDLPLERQMHDAPEELILPHPRLHERGFVLIPFSDIAPLWRHPVSGLTVMEMLATLPEAEKAAIEPL